MKTAELVGPALDWAVAKCEGFDTRNNCVVEYSDGVSVFEFLCFADDNHHAMEQVLDAYPAAESLSVEFILRSSPSTDWSQGGPIIEREEIGIKRNAPCSQGREWEASPSITAKGAGGKWGYGPTPLIAAMRCYVSSKLGDEVEIPEGL